MPAKDLLSDLKIKHLKPDPSRAYKRSDGAGLFLLVHPNGSKYWRFSYYWAQARQEIHLGQYPDLPLSRARELRDEARRDLASGVNPRDKKKAAQIALAYEAKNTFAAMAEDWVERKAPEWAPGTLKDCRKRLKAYILPALGPRPMAAIKTPELVQLLRDIETRGGEIAKRCRILIRSIFQHAINLGVIEFDPTTTLSAAFNAPAKRHFPAPTEPAAVGSILRAIHAPEIAGTVVSLALRLHPLVAVRPGELEAARWADFDFEAREWRFVPPKARKRAEHPHIVPLSRQALDILEQARKATVAASPWVFPNERSTNRPMSNGAMRATLARVGISSDVLVPHGWRAVFRTLGREQCGFEREWLEMQLAHTVPDTLGRAYNRTQWLKERREMMQRWADYLDELRLSAASGDFPRSAAG